MATKAPHRTDVLKQDTHSIGAIGQAGRQAQKHQDGQRQERATPGDDVEGAGYHPGGEEQQVPPHDSQSSARLLLRGRAPIESGASRCGPLG